MCRLGVALLLLVATSLTTAAANNDENPNYTQLTANNFQSEIDNKDVVLVCFYHSKAEPEDDLDPEFVQAANRLAGKGATLATVDCAVEKTLQRKYEIEDFPSVRLFRDGNVYHFKRALETNAIVSFVEGLMTPALETLATVGQAVELTESDNAVLIGFFSPENTKEYEVFLSVASSFQASDNQNLHFAEVVNPQVVKEFEIVYTPMVFLFRPKEDAIGYTGMFNERELADWITISTTPTLKELLPTTFLTIFEDNTPTLLCFVDQTSPTTGPLLATLTELSVNYLHKLNFVFTERTHFGGLADKMGIPAEGNVVTILDFHKREHYILPNDNNPTTNTITQFCDEFLGGKLVRAEDGDGGVVGVDAEHVPETIVIANPTTDVMMEFFVPWCDFFINIGVPHSGVPSVAILNQLPNIAALEQPQQEQTQQQEQQD